MGWIGLATVLLQIVKNFLQNRTPEAKRNYVKNLQKMSSALVDDDTAAVNNLFDELRQEAGFGDGAKLDKEPERDVHGDSGVA